MERTNTYLNFSSNTKEEANAIFNALKKDGNVTMELGQQPWGYFGSVIDRYRVQWMVIYGG